MQQRPKRPIRAVKTDHEQVSETRPQLLRTCCSKAIGFVNKCESAIASDFCEASGDFAQGRFGDLVEVPASGMKLIDHAQEMIGIASDRFCHQGLRIFSDKLFGCNRQQQTQVFA